MEKIRQDTSPNALCGIEICESRVIEKKIKKFSIQYANDKLICKDDELSFFVYL
jgi:hypothetical protein